ncbi:MAG: Hsp33 family molecular chaperone HslO [Clostridiaceae bacterium]
MDKLIKATALNGDVRIIAAVTTDLVNKAVKIHQCAPTAAAAFGRMLTAGSIIGSMLKAKEDSLTLQIDGGGPIKGITVTSYADAHVKGYVGNPAADLPPNEKGKLDVSGVVGLNGSLVVIRDMGLKEPYVGQVPIRTGEIGDDLAYYYTVSEQTPSAVGVGVLVDKNLSVKAAGGFLIQMMPDADEMAADLITYRLQDMGSITEMIDKGMSAEDIVNFIFEDMQVNILESIVPEYKCDCTREKVEKALISIGGKELGKLYDEGKTEELQCQFCNEKYLFTKDEIGKLLEEATK